MNIFHFIQWLIESKIAITMVVFFFVGFIIRDMMIPSCSESETNDTKKEN